MSERKTTFPVSHPEGKWARGNSKSIPTGEIEKQERRRCLDVAQLRASRHRGRKLNIQRARRQLQQALKLFQREAVDELTLRNQLSSLFSVITFAEKQCEKSRKPARFEEIQELAQELLQCYLDGNWPVGSEHYSDLSTITANNPPHERAESSCSAAAQNHSYWHPIKPTREQGYNTPLYEYLKAAHLRGATSPPTAAEILKHWQTHPPPGYGIHVAKDLSEFTYESDGKRPIRTVDRKAFGQAMRRRISYTNNK